MPSGKCCLVAVRLYSVYGGDLVPAGGCVDCCWGFSARNNGMQYYIVVYENGLRHNW